jgi:hypothetical protein
MRGTNATAAAFKSAAAAHTSQKLTWYNEGLKRGPSILPSERDAMRIASTAAREEGITSLAVVIRPISANSKLT